LWVKGLWKKSLRGKAQRRDFPLRLEIPQRQRDFHFYHSPGDGELTFRFHPGKKNS
jgi:hypothetical protein